jgi:hypothetical protein
VAQQVLEELADFLLPDVVVMELEVQAHAATSGADRQT